MDLTYDFNSNLQNALPHTFDFYHLGSVELKPMPPLTVLPEPIELNGVTGIAYQFKGDFQGLLLLLVASELDVSTYSEMGNIIASRLANSLQSKEGLDVLITPPKVLERAQVARIIQSNPNQIYSAYDHILENLVVPVQTLLFPNWGEGSGNA